MSSILQKSKGNKKSKKAPRFHIVGLMVVLLSMLTFIPNTILNTSGRSFPSSLPNIIHSQDTKQTLRTLSYNPQISFDQTEPNNIPEEATSVKVNSEADTVFSLSETDQVDWYSLLLINNITPYTLYFSTADTSQGVDISLYESMQPLSATEQTLTFISKAKTNTPISIDTGENDTRFVLVKISYLEGITKNDMPYSIEMYESSKNFSPLKIVSSLTNETATPTVQTQTTTPPSSTVTVTVQTQTTIPSTTTVTPTGTGTSTIDPYEPDDTSEQAKAIDPCKAGENCASKTQENHQFLTENDEDWLTFYAGIEAGIYTIETTNITSRTDTILYLYDATGTNLLATNDNVDDYTTNSKISFSPLNFTGRGEYKIKVKPVSKANTGSSTKYSISVKVSIPPTSTPEPNEIHPDDYDSYQRIASNTTDDKPGYGEWLSDISKTSTTHNFHVSSDVDWISFNISLLGHYRIFIDNDVMLYLYNSSLKGHLATTNSADQASAASLSMDSQEVVLRGSGMSGLAEPAFSTYLDYNFYYPGTYYLKITYPGNKSLKDSAYRLRILSLLAQPTISPTTTIPTLALRDGYEWFSSYSDNLPESAPIIHLDWERHIDSLHELDDVDWKQFTISSPQSVFITLHNFADTQGLQLKLFRVFAPSDKTQTGMFEMMKWGSVTLSSPIDNINIEVITNLYIDQTLYSFSQYLGVSGTYYIGIVNPDNKKGKYYTLAVSSQSSAQTPTATSTPATTTPVQSISPSASATKTFTPTPVTGANVNILGMGISGLAAPQKDIWDILLPVDNSITTGELIVPDGQEQRHTLHDFTDQDWILLNVKTAERYHILIHTTTPIHWYLFQNTSNGLKRLVDKDIQGEENYLFKPATTEEYYLHFTQIEGTPHTSNDSYTVKALTDPFFKKVKGLIDTSPTPLPSATTSTTTSTPTGNSSQTSTPNTTQVSSTPITTTETSTPTITLTPRPIRNPDEFLSVMVLYKAQTLNTATTPSTATSSDQFIGSPLSGAKVTVSSIMGNKYTNLNGVAYFEQVPAGKYTVWVEYMGRLKSADVDTTVSKSVVITIDPTFLGRTAAGSSGSAKTTVKTNNKTLPQTGAVDVSIFVGGLSGLLFSTGLKIRRRKKATRKKTS